MAVEKTFGYKPDALQMYRYRRFLKLVRRVALAFASGSRITSLDDEGGKLHCQPWQLAPDRLVVVKDVFEYMLRLGIIDPSDSPWVSHLQMVPKAIQ